MASLRKRLRNLFSTNVIVRKYGKEKLRVVDTNRLQSTGNFSQSKLTDRYSRLHGSSRTGYGSYGSGYGGYAQIIILNKIENNYILIMK